MLGLLLLLLLTMMMLMMMMQIPVLYRTYEPVPPAIYVVQVLGLSPDVDGSPYLVPQALVNVLPKQQDANISKLVAVNLLLIHDLLFLPISTIESRVS